MDVLFPRPASTTPAPRFADSENPPLIRSAKPGTVKRRGLADISNGINTPAPAKPLSSANATQPKRAAAPEIETATRFANLVPAFVNPHAERALKYAATPRAWLDLPSEEAAPLSDYVPEGGDYESAPPAIDSNDVLFA